MSIGPWYPSIRRNVIEQSKYRRRSQVACIQDITTSKNTVVVSETVSKSFVTVIHEKTILP